MITFFTTPKAFRGHIGTIQTNAINSWIHLSPKPEIFLVGNDEGIPEIVDQLGLKHLSLSTQVPVLDELFQKVRQAASYPYLCFINSDIILLDDFMPTFEQVSQKFEKFLMISSRWNLDIETILPLEKQEDRNQLKYQATQEHNMYPAAGSDFFVFGKEMYKEMPAFLKGRGFYDNWLICKAKKEGAKVIDVTSDVIAVHQNHDYAHIQGMAEQDRTINFARIEQGKRNLELAGGQKNIYTNYDADYVLVNGRFYCSWNLKFIFRRLKSSIRRLKIRLISQK